MQFPCNHWRHSPAYCRALVLVFITLAACTDRPPQPSVTLHVINVYHEECTVTDAQFLYSWEERGETPFLKPYSLETQEYIIEVMEPVPGAPRKVTLQSRRIPFPDIASIEMQLTSTGKIFLVHTRRGETVTTSGRFPPALKKGEKTGLADYKVYVIGTCRAGCPAGEDVKIDLNTVKRIEFADPPDSAVPPAQ